MIDRYSVSCNSSQLRSRFNIEVHDAYMPRYNAAPTQLLPVITSNSPEGLSFFYWGIIPGWSQNKNISKKLLNAHVSELSTKTSYKRSLSSNRCIIPADGYYAWKKVGKKTLIPYRVSSKDNQIISFPGIWEEFEDEHDQTHHTFKIITTNSIDYLSDINPIMPVILNRSTEALWLSNNVSEEDLFHALEQTSAVDKLYPYTVSPKINEIKNDSPDLIIPSTPSDQFGNYSLFD